MFKTRVTELLGIEYPIIQGGMMWVSKAELVSAVSNAGALGVLYRPATPPELQAEIRRCRTMTKKPFAVNIGLFPALRPVDIDAFLDVVIAEGVKIIETAGRSPEPYIEKLKKAGVTVMHKCTAPRFAKTAERVGCNAVIIDGFECGGHPGEEDVTSLMLIPLAADTVKVPLIAAGGFADARGLVAALALGAEAVLMGTRFMATQECPIDPKIKQFLVDASERDTILMQRSLKNTSRVIKNTVSTRVVEMEAKGAKLEDLAGLITGQRTQEVVKTGDIEKGTLACGMSVGLVHDIPTVKQLIDQIISEATEIRKRLAGDGRFQPMKHN